MPFAPSFAPPGLLDAAATAARLPWSALADEIAALLQDNSVVVPQRTVLPLAQGGSLFVMPATDQAVAMTKLITLTPGNAGTGRPSIQGDVVVFDIATGERRLVLDGPTVTARRTAAASLLAAQRLAPVPQGPLLIVGAGVQGRLEQCLHTPLTAAEIHRSRTPRATPSAIQGCARRRGAWSCRQVTAAVRGAQGGHALLKRRPRTSRTHRFRLSSVRGEVGTESAAP